MSFTAEFDYTNHTALCDERIAAYTGIINAANAKIAELNNVVGYADFVAKQLQQQQSTKTMAEGFILKLNQLKAEIAVVEALSVGNKQTLYDFYVASGDRRDSYGLRVLFNHAAIIAEATVLLADNALSPDMKMSIGMDICHKYPIDSRANELRGAKFPNAV